MGVYMGYLKNTSINIGSRTSRFCLSRQDPKTEDRTGRVGRAEADRQETDVVCPKPSCAVSGFNRTDLSLRPSVAEETGNGPPKDTWSFHLRHSRLWISSLNRFSLKWHNPEWSDIERRYAWRRCDEPDFLTKKQHLDCRYRQLELSRSRLDKTCAPADRIVGSGTRPSVRKRSHNKNLCRGSTCVWEIWNRIQYAQRERERGTKVYLYYQECNSYNVRATTNLYKRLQSHFI